MRGGNFGSRLSLFAYSIAIFAHTTMTNLLRTAQSFYRISQDTLSPVKAAVEQALSARFPDAQVASIKTVSVIDKQVKVTIHLEPAAAQQTNLTELTQMMRFAISKIDPTLQVSCTLDMSSNATVYASRKKRVKTAQTANGDPLGPVRSAIDSVLAVSVPPDVAEVQAIALVGQTVKVEMLFHPERGTFSRGQIETLLSQAIRRVNPSLQLSLVLNISSEEKVASFRKKLRVKLAQEASANVEATIQESLKGIPGSRLTNVVISGLRIDASIEVPEQHSFTASQLGTTLTKAIQSVLPGGQVIATLSFSTNKTASQRKKAQDRKADVQSVVSSAIAGLQHMALKSFVFQPETKHVLVEVGKSMDSKITAQQISAFLTNKIQAVAPGFSAIATTTIIT